MIKAATNPITYIKEKFRKKVLQSIPDYFTVGDIELFKEGQHFQLYNKLGAHPMTYRRLKGTYFSVWAPNAKDVSVIGDFNDWNKRAHFLKKRPDQSGIFEGFLPKALNHQSYQFYICSEKGNYKKAKMDPYARMCKQPPNKSSVICDLEYSWSDQKWMQSRKEAQALNEPMAVYEVHLGSWCKAPTGNGRFQTYREMGESLVKYVKDMGFTHVEFLPVMEHPFYGSWGYQTLGYFAPTSRYGKPQDLMFLIDRLHQENIGVILDWVPSHFPSDEHGLAHFDGTNLYEVDGLHPDWTSSIFNNGRAQVADFLISSAMFWLDKYHVDGLRVDAVASMLYLDYSRKAGKWLPNFFGGNENVESIAFLRLLNDTVKKQFPDCLMIAEESSIWPKVSKDAQAGGLGFDMKWNMGWMHDTLKYFGKDPKKRHKNPKDLQSCLGYAFDENYVLPFSHDEVVHMKSSLLGKMPGKEHEKFDHLKTLYGYMYGFPGKKLLFMGSELAPWTEWDHDSKLNWHLLQYEKHSGVQKWLKELNRLYRDEKALHEQDFAKSGIRWITPLKAKEGITAFFREDQKGKERILIICHLGNKLKKNHRVKVEQNSSWKIILDSDDPLYDGAGLSQKKNGALIHSQPYKNNHILSLTLPANSIIFLKQI